MTSTTAFPLMNAIRAALIDTKYSSDPVDRFLTSLHASGYEVVKSAEVSTQTGPLPAVADLRGIYEGVADGRAEMPEFVA